MSGVTHTFGAYLTFPWFRDRVQRVSPHVRATSCPQDQCGELYCLNDLRTVLHLISQGAQPVKHIVDTPLVLGSVCNPWSWFTLYLNHSSFFVPTPVIATVVIVGLAQGQASSRKHHSTTIRLLTNILFRSSLVHPNTTTVPTPATSTRPSLVPAQAPRVSVPDITPAATPPQPAKPLTHANVALADEQTRKPSSTFLTADLTDDDDTVVEEVIEDVADEVPSERSQHSTASEKLDRGILSCLNCFISGKHAMHFRPPTLT